MFKAICTNQQVDSSFLEAVYTFGDQEEPKDVCLMNFSAGHTLAAPEDKLISIPELGRSGREIRVSYLLRSVEVKEHRDWPWQIRQAAIYHSFDAETGKSFWLTIKGNDQLSRRVQQSSDRLELPTSSHLSEDPVPYFKASLSTHLVCVSWCDDNWRQCINELEGGVRDILEKARKSPIDDDLEDEPSKLATYPPSQRHSRKGTMQSRKDTGLSEARSGIRKQSTLDVIKGAQRAVMSPVGLFSKRTTTTVDVEMAVRKPSAPDTLQAPENNNSREGLIDRREVLDKFRFSDVQTLHTFGERVRRSILTLKLNISVLRSLGSFYEELLASDIAAFRNIKAACEDDIVDFVAEVKSIYGSLETRLSQLEYLAAILAEGIILYDGILQHRQLDIAQRFQETARESADQMRIIANKTEVETTSMHVITIVTLVFLPGTFVAVYRLVAQTLFQSGVIQWSNAPEDMKEAYRYSSEGFGLFASVSVPVMAITLGIWLAVYLTMRKRLKRNMEIVLPK